MSAIGEIMRKFVVSAVSGLLFLLLLTSTAFAAPAAASRNVPFKGTLNAVEVAVFDPAPNTPADSATGSGNATHLGRFTVSYWVEFDPILPQTGTLYYHFVAANGDSLFSTGLGKGEDVGPNTGHVVETHTITGGTGRFAGATGNFIIDRLITWTWTATGGTGISHGTFKGNIVLAKDE